MATHCVIHFQQSLITNGIADTFELATCGTQIINLQAAGYSIFCIDNRLYSASNAIDSVQRACNLTIQRVPSHSTLLTFGCGPSIALSGECTKSMLNPLSDTVCAVLVKSKFPDRVLNSAAPSNAFFSASARSVACAV